MTRTAPAGSVMRAAFCAIVALCGPVASAHGADTWSVKGYVKTLALAQQAVEVAGAPSGDSVCQSQNALRVMLDWFPGDALAFQLHYEMEPVFTSLAATVTPTDSTFTTAGSRYRYSDIAARIDEGNGHRAVFQNLDRLNVRVRLPRGDLTIGRQAVAFGAARVINPTDLFLPFDVRSLNQEYRIGIDAIRYQRALGDLSELDSGFVLGEGARRENSAFYLQVSGNRSGKDLNLILVHFGRHNLAGAGVQGAIGEAGAWAEAGYVTGADAYLRLSAGLDYAFSERWFGMVEYHFNGAGAGDPDGYPALSGDAAYRSGGVFLRGRHYLISSLSWTVTPLVSLGLQSLVNLDDRSAFLSLSGQWSLSDDAYLNFGLYRFHGRGLRLAAGLAPAIEAESEYGGNPDLLYVSLRYYF